MMTKQNISAQQRVHIQIERLKDQDQMDWIDLYMLWDKVPDYIREYKRNSVQRVQRIRDSLYKLFIEEISVLRNNQYDAEQIIKRVDQIRV